MSSHNQKKGIAMSLETLPSIEALLRRQALYEQVIRTLADQVNALRKKVADNENQPADRTPALTRLGRPPVAEESEATGTPCDRTLAYSRGYITFEEFIGKNTKGKTSL
jgi:hypothetical protein